MQTSNSGCDDSTTEEILLMLTLGGLSLLHLTPWIAGAVVVLLVVVVLSYRQTCHAYPGGGAYAVSRANLGRLITTVSPARYRNSWRLAGRSCCRHAILGFKWCTARMPLSCQTSMLSLLLTPCSGSRETAIFTPDFPPVHVRFSNGI